MLAETERATRRDGLRSGSDPTVARECSTGPQGVGVASVRLHVSWRWRDETCLASDVVKRLHRRSDKGWTRRTTLERLPQEHRPWA